MKYILPQNKVGEIDTIEEKTCANISYKNIGRTVGLVRLVLLATFTTEDNYSLRLPYVL